MSLIEGEPSLALAPTSVNAPVDRTLDFADADLLPYYEEDKPLSSEPKFLGDDNNRQHEHPQVTSEQIAKAKLGDREAIEEIFSFYYDRVLSICRLKIGSNAADDVTQEVFVSAFLGLQEFEDRGLPFSGWLARIAFNKCTDYVRHEQYVGARRSVVSIYDDGVIAYARDVDPFADPEWVVENVEAAQELSQMLSVEVAKLSPGERKVMYRRYGKGWSNAEIAADLSKTENNVKQFHHKSIRKLRRAFAQ